MSGRQDITLCALCLGKIGTTGDLFGDLKLVDGLG